MWIRILLIVVTIYIFMSLLQISEMDMPVEVYVSSGQGQNLLVTTDEQTKRGGLFGDISDVVYKNNFFMLGEKNEPDKPIATVYGEVFNTKIHEDAVWIFWRPGGASKIDLKGQSDNREAYIANLPENWAAPVSASVVYQNKLWIFKQDDSGKVLYSHNENGKWSEITFSGLVRSKKSKLAGGIASEKSGICLYWFNIVEEKEKKLFLNSAVFDPTKNEVSENKSIEITQAQAFTINYNANGDLEYYGFQGSSNMFSSAPLMFSTYKNGDWTKLIDVTKDLGISVPQFPNVEFWSNDSVDYMVIFSKINHYILHRENGRWIVDYNHNEHEEKKGTSKGAFSASKHSIKSVGAY